MPATCSMYGCWSGSLEDQSGNMWLVWMYLELSEIISLVTTTWCLALFLPGPLPSYALPNDKWQKHCSPRPLLRSKIRAQFCYSGVYCQIHCSRFPRYENSLLCRLLQHSAVPLRVCPRRRTELRWLPGLWWVVRIRTIRWATWLNLFRPYVHPHAAWRTDILVRKDILPPAYSASISWHGVPCTEFASGYGSMFSFFILQIRRALMFAKRWSSVFLEMIEALR